MTRRRLAALAALLVTTLAASACSGDRDALTIYSGRDEALVGPLLERFAEETDTPIDVRYGDSADLALLIAEEGESTPADVFFSQSPGAVEFLAGEGMLGDLEPGLVDKVRAGFAGSEGDWVGVTARQRVLVYNKELVSEDALPDSVFDLTAKRFEGKVGLAPPNASFQDFITAMRQLEGDDKAEEWLEGMVANNSPTFPDNSSIVAAVGRGEIPLGLVNHYYNYRFLAEDPTLPSRNYVFPNEDVGALLIAASVSVIDTSDKKDAAQDFVEFLLSQDSQEYFAQETFEYPLVPQVEASDELPPLESLDAPDYEIENLGGGLKGTVELIAESGLL